MYILSLIVVATSTTRLYQCSVRDLRLTVQSVSTRVHEASLIARLIGRLETEHVQMIYAHIGAVRRCPTGTNGQRLNCTTATSPLSPINCSLHTTSQNFSSKDASSKSLVSVATATHDTVWKTMKNTEIWYKLSKKSRNFLRSIRPLHPIVTVNASVHAISGDYSAVVDELMLLLPVPSRDVTLPHASLCVDCETALFASVSALLTLASAQHATGSQCFLGHVFYACGRLSALERFYFRSNWSRVDSKLRDVLNRHSDSTTTEQLYADTIECSQRVFAATSESIEQSRGCAATDDVISWYSACKQMLNSTKGIMESLIAGSHDTIAAARHRCTLEIVVYALLICLQVCFII